MIKIYIVKKGVNINRLLEPMDGHVKIVMHKRNHKRIEKIKENVKNTSIDVNVYDLR